jgi:hypothetical protein
VADPAVVVGTSRHRLCDRVGPRARRRPRPGGRSVVSFRQACLIC